MKRNNIAMERQDWKRLVEDWFITLADFTQEVEPLTHKLYGRFHGYPVFQTSRGMVIMINCSYCSNKDIVGEYCQDCGAHITQMDFIWAETYSEILDGIYDN